MNPYPAFASTFRGYWDWINVQSVVRPSRLLSDAQKDQNYDAVCARYYLGNQLTPQVNVFRRAYATNIDYASGFRWGEDEDTKLFLGDGTATTSRTALHLHIVQPMLTRLRGMADNISVAPKVTAITRFAKTRKEDDMLRRVLMSVAARSGAMMTAAYAPMGITGDEQSAIQSHESNYQDLYAKAVEMMVSIIAKDNDIDQRRSDIAQSIALSGLAAMHCSVVGSKLVWELCDPGEVGFDPTCLKPDFTDAEYVFTCPLMQVSSIAEKYQPAKEKIEAIDKWSRTNIGIGGANSNGWPQSLPRVFTVYWNDCSTIERGYVLKDGEACLVTVNHKNPDSREGDPLYTDADLITPPDNRYTASWTDEEIAQKKQKRYVEQIRYCSFIPWEYLPGGFTNKKEYAKRSELGPERLKFLSNSGDLVLSSGVYQLQESDPDDTYRKGFPLKFSTWTYIAGNVIAPLTAAISPQRVANQVTSDLMWRLRKSGNRSVAIDTDAMGGSSMSEGEIRNALKEGDPVDLKGAIVGGLQNAVRDIDTSPGNSFYQMFAMLPQIKQFSESATGIYEGNYGAPQGQDQLVGTLQLQLQQAGVMQQPFSKAVASLIRQVHQHGAQVGKQHYATYPWILSQMSGDDGMEAIIASKEMQNEQFRVEVEMTVEMEKQRQFADLQVIPMLLQMGMLDQFEAAKLFGRATAYDAYRASEAFLAKKQQAEAMAQQAAQQQQAAQALALEDAAIRDEEAEISKEQTKADLDMAKIQAKLMQPEAQAAAEWNKPPDQNVVTG